ncbi:unnamed protein product [Adineta steineri]|uniref:Tudor domain-containing protein n=1 Tax=Adineta steineri TaxID=433720 RepID=A0A818N2N7_9BILA|nr:unnamed protein product [Adineta steineri]CAF3598983.1 unnamed protein product [Adineta steineri]
MQRPLRGYRGGIRIGPHFTHTHSMKHKGDDDDNNNNNNNRSSSPNSNPDDMNDDINENNSTIKSKCSSRLSSKTINTDFESAIRSIRPLATNEKTTKTKPNIYSQKADLPLLNIIDKTTDNINDKQSDHWFPKSDIGHVNSTDFIRHNHIESQQIKPPSLLTTSPPVGISTRPTAIIAPAGPTRSTSAFFTSNSSIKSATSYSIDDLQNNSSLKLNQHSKTSAFQPINSTQNSPLNTIDRQLKMKSQSTPMDIPKHKILERGQRLTKVHISHPQSPSIVHLMLSEDFNIACRLLHKMAAHPELQSNYIPTLPFKPEINHICACFHEGRWFRCRILEIPSNLTTVTVIYLDWGMMIPVKIDPKYIRYLPNEFYADPACSIICHLDGVPNQDDSIPANIITQCITLLSEDEYDVIVNDFHSTTGGKIILSINGQNINEQIQKLLLSNKIISAEDELIEQFQHEIQLSVGDELKALLSSFSGKDDSFYVLLINDNTAAIDRAMNQLQEDHIPNREFLQIPQIKTLVVARYTDDGKYYRAWVKTIDLQHEQALVFFVDFGNESNVSFSDIYICPESVRTLPWLGIHVRLTNDKMTIKELTEFWKLTESHYIWIRVNEILKDSYGIQIKIDYTVYLRHERLKMLTSKQLIHKNIQTKSNEIFTYPKTSSEKNLSLLLPSTNDQNQIGNENILRSLIEMINNELRSLRHRINDSDEASQDRHSQLMQLLFTIVNLNNSNYQNMAN